MQSKSHFQLAWPKLYSASHKKKVFYCIMINIQIRLCICSVSHNNFLYLVESKLSLAQILIRLCWWVIVTPSESIKEFAYAIKHHFSIMQPLHSSRKHIFLLLFFLLLFFFVCLFVFFLLFFFFVFFFLFQPRSIDIFLFLHENIICGYSLEVPQWSASDEYPHIILYRRNKTSIYLDTPLNKIFRAVMHAFLHEEYLIT